MKNFRRFWLITPMVVGLLVLAVAMTVFSGIVSDTRKLFFIDATMTLFAISAVILLWDRMDRSTHNYLARLSRQLAVGERSNFENVPLPAATIDKSGEIIWYNEWFRQAILNGGAAHGTNIRHVFPKFDMTEPAQGRPFELRREKNYYMCAAKSCSREDTGRYIIYFSDISELKRTEQKYNDQKPGVILVVFDNADDLLREQESERMRIMSEVDRLINAWVADMSCICWADARDKSLIILEHADIEKIIADKFSILGDVRKIITKDNQMATLSIGAGIGGESITETEGFARQALDMALSRGGDQAAVRAKDGYTFFGGTTNSSERQSRVRMRMFASSISERISSCENCFIMGHRYSDLDSVGAAIGLYSLAKGMDKEAYIAVDRGGSLAKELIDSYSAVSAGKDVFIDPESALDRVREGSLVIVVDTHSPGFLESKTLYDRATCRIVIDHHRMMVDRLEGADLFIQEPHASSVSEMVTEMATYISDRAINRAEAEALLAGIMLDTNSFVLRTGVRTFEAAAFLRRRGADTIEVRRFFSGSLDAYIEKSRLVSSAAIHRRCAISCADEPSAEIRVVSAQAAGEMLAIKDVDAAFVLYEQGGNTSISARSLGKVNVQVIMERLGGGGHLTMAGAQLDNTPKAAALEKLRAMIDEYYK